MSDSRFKEILRTIYWNYRFFQFNQIIQKVSLLADGQLLMELNDGTKYYGESEDTIWPAMKYGVPQKMAVLSEYNNFGGFLWALMEQYTYSTYYQGKFTPRKGDVVVDIGANIGVVTVRSARIVGQGGRVVAIEPEINNVRLLQKNIVANNLSNVTIVGKGAWSHKGNLSLNVSSCGLEHSFYSDNNFLAGKSRNHEQVNVDTLDNILYELDIKKVDIIKLDVEGSEIEVIKGMNNTLLKNHVKLIGESHLINNVNTYNSIQKQLNQLGYLVKNKGGVFYGIKNN